METRRQKFGGLALRMRSHEGLMVAGLGEGRSAAAFRTKASVYPEGAPELGGYLELNRIRPMRSGFIPVSVSHRTKKGV